MEFNTSKTRENLMRSFAGECQARGRYELAAGKAHKEKLHVIEAVFKFTANQEKEHAEVFYKLLNECSGETIVIDGSYPVDLSPRIEDMLKNAHHNEMEEFNDVYKNFAKIAEEEGFYEIANKYKMISEIEKSHGERFEYFEQLIRQEKLFISDVKTGWMCLNCGYIFEGLGAPKTCPVCSHDQGFFVRLELAPFVSNQFKM